MINVLYKLYALTDGSHFLEKLKVDAINRHLWRWVANGLLPIYYRCTSYNHKYKWPILDIRESMTIGSLTSFPARINNLWIVIESILHQDQKLDALFLWLSKDQFPTIDKVPMSLRKLTTRGLRIELVDDDLRSHKKYYYVLKKYPGCNLFTFDDDIIYPTNTISSVMRVVEKNPNCVVGRYSNHIKKNDDGTVGFDRQNKKLFVNLPSWSTFIGSGGGTFYPVGSFPSITLKNKVFMDICKTADDVWLNLMCRFNGYKIVATQKKCRLIEVINKNAPTLTEVNYGAENQKQINAVRDYCINNGRDPFEELN